MDKEKIAYCGVDCSVCPDLLEGRCLGCRGTVWEAGDECHPVVCCREKGLSFCGQCDVFPCEQMVGFYKESESHRQAYLRMCSLKKER
ncbi:MAG: DUF3795 domain-containing protein [Oscillospiraceae bacterium]|nr:DUF3795 domain-containing protein [Oscillospiraceae bacterium]